MRSPRAVRSFEASRKTWAKSRAVCGRSPSAVRFRWRTFSATSSRLARSFQSAASAPSSPRFPLPPDQKIHELVIGRWKLERRQILPRHPSHLLVHLRNRFAAKGAFEEMKFHAALGILMTGGQEFASDGGVDRQLFTQLPQETTFE